MVTADNQPQPTTNPPDIKPRSQIITVDRAQFANNLGLFPVRTVAPVVGMSPSFIRRVCGPKRTLDARDVLNLIDQDSYRETLVPRSAVLGYLESNLEVKMSRDIVAPDSWDLLRGHSLNYIRRLKAKSVHCVVTSTPYWGMRIYEGHRSVKWADGELSAYGHEQTPEGFLRHTTEVLEAILAVLSDDGSVWWNIMDTYNTRTQIRRNASEALQAMQGKDDRGWLDYQTRRYSAGHSFLKDGEQCIIPARVAERASAIGYYVKSIITWAKPTSLPEPQQSRVSRRLEYVLHLAKRRMPKFNRSSYLTVPESLGGRQRALEPRKLSDIWTIPTSAGRGGHGAQFPIALPARCIALSTDPGDLVMDPFVGAGNAGVAALRMGRRFLGMDVSQIYLSRARRTLAEQRKHL